ncbi:MAG: hypothetical protein ACYCRD_01255 [Leptospirillum sp.]
MDDDRSRYDSLGVSHSRPGQGSRRVYWILGSVAVLFFVGGIVYTIFFYMTLPNRHTLLRAGENGVNQVPLPVPPTSLFPESNPSRPPVLQIDTPRFVARVTSVRSEGGGLDIRLRLTFEHLESGPVSLVLSSPPRWVDGKQGASPGEMPWSQDRLFHNGDSVDIPVHFSVFPRTPSFDLYVSFTGLKGNTGKRYILHFVNLKAGSGGV